MATAYPEQLTGQEILEQAINNTDEYLERGRRHVEEIVREDLARRAELFRRAREAGLPPPFGP